MHRLKDRGELHSGESLPSHILDSEQEQRQKDISAIKFFLARLISFLVILFVFFHCIFNIKVVPDLAMKPKLMAGDISLVYRLNKEYGPGDVVFYNACGKCRVGRIVGIETDKIVIEDGVLKVNDSVVLDGDIYYRTDPLEDKVSYPVQLSHNQYFILGDMRTAAKDSRYFGPVDKDDIVGSVVTVIRRSEI